MTMTNPAHFADRLTASILRVGNPVLVGIDPRLEDLPPSLVDQYTGDLAGLSELFLAFGRGVIDVVSSKVAAIKLQSAFYEAYGPEGVNALHATSHYGREKGLIVVIDGKRNDIGSTAEAYARAYLGKVPIGANYQAAWDADALTINPYLGEDGVNPFLKVASRENKGVFVLVRTSNPSAVQFQDLVSEGLPIYRHVAERMKLWGDPYRGESGYSLLGAVVGATYPTQLAELRETLAGVWLLVPGYGSQGASSADVSPAFDSEGLGALINNSRGITFAYNRPQFRDKFGNEWQRAVEEALNEMIIDLSANTPAGRLKKSDAV